ncbi:MAG: hypothetical protein ACLVAT_08125 [Lachnospiraceae bacterium]
MQRLRWAAEKRVFGLNDLTRATGSRGHEKASMEKAALKGFYKEGHK